MPSPRQSFKLHPYSPKQNCTCTLKQRRPRHAPELRERLVITLPPRSGTALPVSGFSGFFARLQEHHRAPAHSGRLRTDHVPLDGAPEARKPYCTPRCMSPWRMPVAQAGLLRIFEGLERGRARGARDFGTSLLWIFDACVNSEWRKPRRFSNWRPLPGPSSRRRRIGGDELKAPPELFRTVYGYAEVNGLRLTAHAGETGSSESIWGRSICTRSRIVTADRRPGSRLDRGVGVPPDSARDLPDQ